MTDFTHVLDFLRERWLLMYSCIQQLFSVFGSVYYGSDRVPGVVIATDIICRFPTETDEVGQRCSIISSP